MDNELLAQWQTGDQAAGQALVERYYERLHAFFSTRFDHEADELVQATFLACLAAKDSYRGDATFKTFLYGIAKHHLYDALRRRHRDRDRQHESRISWIADAASTPRTLTAQNEERERVVRAMRRLSAAQQTLLEMYYWHDLEMAELAAIFKAPEVTIRSRLHRARLALRDVLQRDPPRAEVAVGC